MSVFYCFIAGVVEEGHQYLYRCEEGVEFHLLFVRFDAFKLEKACFSIISRSHREMNENACFHLCTLYLPGNLARPSS